MPAFELALLFIGSTLIVGKEKKLIAYRGYIMKIILRVPENRICELWLETETTAQFLARQGAHGLDRMGWHNHHGSVTGDWHDVEEVLMAYRINPDTLH